VAIRDPADGHTELVVAQRELQQGPGGDHRQFGQVFPEPAQRRQQLRGRLNFIEEQQGRLRLQTETQVGRQVAERLVGVVVAEVLGVCRVTLQVQFDKLPAAALGQVSNQPRLPNLPRATQHQGLAVSGGEP